MRRPTPLDRITREGSPKTWGTAIVRARAEGNDIILPDGPRLSDVHAEGIDISGRNVDVPPGLHGKTARNFREHVIAHARPAPHVPPRLVRQKPRPFSSCIPSDSSSAPSLSRLPDFHAPTKPPSAVADGQGQGERSRRRFAPQASVAPPTSAVFSSPAGCTSPVCARPPFQMTHAGFHRKTPARSTQNRRRQSSAARNGACSPLRRVFRLGLSDESRHLLPRFRPCTATLAPQLCLPEGLRHTVFWKVLPKSCLFLLHGAFSMYIFSRIKNKTPLRSKRNNVNERIGLITGMI